MSTTLYLPIANVASDAAATQPLPQVSIPTPFQQGPVKWGDRYGNTPRDSLHLETFDPPGYGPYPWAMATSPRVPDPIAYSFGTVRNQSTSNIEKQCPTYPIPLRNHWETYPTNSGKYYGGFTEHSIRDVPSCSDMDGPYMNFMAFATQPWARAIVHQRPETMSSDARIGIPAHSIPRWISSRLQGHKIDIQPPPTEFVEDAHY